MNVNSIKKIVYEKQAVTPAFWYKSNQYSLSVAK